MNECTPHARSQRIFLRNKKSKRYIIFQIPWVLKNGLEKTWAFPLQLMQGWNNLQTGFFDWKEVAEIRCTIKWFEREGCTKKLLNNSPQQSVRCQPARRVKQNMLTKNYGSCERSLSPNSGPLTWHPATLGLEGHRGPLPKEPTPKGTPKGSPRFLPNLTWQLKLVHLRAQADIH